MDDGGHIELILETVGRWAVMSVRDTGIGIEASVLPRIFDLFMQVNGSISRVNEGLGIGLALVRRRRRASWRHRARRDAGLGHGTEFVVRLPLLETPIVLHANGRQKIASTVNAPTKRILIIDDNKDATDSMAILLRTAGHEVRTAYDGRTALVLCRLERASRMPRNRLTGDRRAGSLEAAGTLPRLESRLASHANDRGPPDHSGMDLISGGHHPDPQASWVAKRRTTAYAGRSANDGDQGDRSRGSLRDALALLPPSLVSDARKPTGIEPPYPGPRSASSRSWQDGMAMSRVLTVRQPLRTIVTIYRQGSACLGGWTKREAGENPAQGRCCHRREARAISTAMLVVAGRSPGHRS